MAYFDDWTSYYVVYRAVFIALPIALPILLSVFVIVCIWCLCHRRPKVWTAGSTKFLVMLVFCAVFVLRGAFPTAVTLHGKRLTDDMVQPSRQFWLFAELTYYFMLDIVVVVLVATIIIGVETLPRQSSSVTVTSMDQAFETVVFVLCIVVYHIPAFIGVTRLEDSKQRPCPEGANYLEIFSTDINVYVLYAVPHFVVLFSCVLLLVARVSTPGVVIPSPGGSPTGNLEAQSRSTCVTLPTSSATPSRPAFQYYVLLASGVTFPLFRVMWFMHSVPCIGEVTMKMLAVGTLLCVLPLSCCWLLKSSIQALRWCSGKLLTPQYSSVPTPHIETR